MNHGPLDLQSNALPLSYTPLYTKGGFKKSLYIHTTKKSNENNFQKSLIWFFKRILGGTRSWTMDLSICSRMLYHWAIPPHVKTFRLFDIAELKTRHLISLYYMLRCADIIVLLWNNLWHKTLVRCHKSFTTYIQRHKDSISKALDFQF